MPLFEEKHLTIHHDEDVNCIHMQWTGFATSAKYKHGMNTGLEKVQEKGVTRWLANMAEMGAITPDDQKWTNENWFPRLLEAGIRTAAVVMSKDVFNQLAVKKIGEDMTDNSYTMHFFDDLEEAKKWLKEYEIQEKETLITEQEEEE
ncbi:STAS/SEC14 domain-containing protein [Bernardetia sp. ABR2-2B]|uniref:STAS/SEC14 domain-containing protein n=1 Tax=Bernardetia sp. ABR2-2B TaxID=3127472 RepID=UPI0030CE1E78